MPLRGIEIMNMKMRKNRAGCFKNEPRKVLQEGEAINYCDI